MSPGDSQVDVLWGVSLGECGVHLSKSVLEKPKGGSCVPGQNKGGRGCSNWSVWRQRQEDQRCVQTPHCAERARVAVGQQILGGMGRPKYDWTSRCRREGGTAFEPVNPGCVHTQINTSMYE